MLKGNSIALIVLSVLTGIVNIVSFNFTGLFFSAAVFCFSCAALARKDNASLGVALIGITALAFLLGGGIITKAVFAVETILSVVLAFRMKKYRNEKYPFLRMSEAEIREEKQRRAEERAAAEAKAEEEAGASGEAVTEAEEEPQEEAEAADACGCCNGTADECTCEEAPEEEEVPEMKEEDIPVPSITEMITSEDEVDENTEFMTEDAWVRMNSRIEEISKEEEPAVPVMDDEMIRVVNTTDEHYESPRTERPSFGAPEVIVLTADGEGSKTPKKMVLKSIFRRDENMFHADEPFFIESEEGFGYADRVKIVRYTIRNRTGRAWKYLTYGVRLRDILGNPVETDDDVSITLERDIAPGEVFIADIPSSSYGATRGVGTYLRAAVDGRGEVFTYHHEENEEERRLVLPELVSLDGKFGEDTDEFLEDYAEEYKLGFTPKYAYTLNEQGSACTCPCCGEASAWEDRKCPLCGAPRDRFVYAAEGFMKRCLAPFREKRAKRLAAEEADRKAREAAEKAVRDRADAEKKAEDNRKNNIRMWTATFIVAVFILLAWLYYHI